MAGTPLTPDQVKRVHPPFGSTWDLADNRDHVAAGADGKLLETDLSITTDRLGVWRQYKMIAGEQVDHGPVANAAAMLALHTFGGDPLLNTAPRYVAPGDSCTRTDDPGWRWFCMAGNGTVITQWERRPLAGAVSARPLCGCKVYLTYDVYVANSIEWTVFCDAENWDTHGFHDPSNVPDRLTVPEGLDGIFMVQAGVTWEGNAAGTRQLYLVKNGDRTEGNSLAFTSGLATGTLLFRANCSTVVQLAAGDYIQMLVYQNRGGGLVMKGALNRTWLAMTRIADAP